MVWLVHGYSSYYSQICWEVDVRVDRHVGVSQYGPSCITAVPTGHQGPVSWKTIFSQIGGGREGFGMIQVRYTYYALLSLLHQLYL